MCYGSLPDGGGGCGLAEARRAPSDAALEDWALPAPLPQPGCDRGMVLVVDDVAVNRMVLSAQAQALGFSVVLAQSGSEAVRSLRGRHSAAPQLIEQFARHAPGLAAVLLDLQLPGALDGWDAAIAMRALEASALCSPPRGGAGARSGGAGAGGVPIVACTACAPDGAVPPAAGGGGGAGRTVRQHALECGVDAVVHKPVATLALRALVDTLLARRRGSGTGDGVWGAGGGAPLFTAGGAGPPAAAAAAAQAALAALLGAAA